ncbi:hypothetical protein C823_001595 [Eubacterium plexicaudatum ASF492]|uniref:Uncharacterized protein n=1 Tax=Eubacterium plexicaudatum ASF492 TaxID=1235802 RepID=N2B414_9FIRM|nr:hypothetical protein C823_001595 [Eubacterium plexicaudatum ASF492]
MSFYSNAYDHMVVVMDCGDLEVIYGAASEKAYEKLMKIMEGLGESGKEPESVDKLTG